MDNYRGNDAEVESIIDGEGEDDWADSHVIRRFAEDLREAYVKPLDSATQSRHLAAIADAVSQNARGPHALPPAQRPVTDGSRCASTSVRAAGPTRVAKVSNVSLASPFGARTASASSGSRPGPRTSLSSVENPAEPKTASRWMRSGAFVNSMTSKAAVVATAIALSASGLAIAGALPDPMQTAFSEAAQVIGLDIPTPIQPPDTSSAPPREQAVPSPTLPVPELVVPQEPLPTPIVPAPPPPAQTPSLQAHQPAAPIVPPGAPADLESWMTELIRQALAAANAKAMYPQAQTDAGTGQQSGQSAGQSWAQDNPWESYGWSGSQSKPKTTGASPTPSPSPSQYGYPQGRSQSQQAGNSTAN